MVGLKVLLVLLLGLATSWAHQVDPADGGAADLVSVLDGGVDRHGRELMTIRGCKKYNGARTKCLQCQASQAPSTKKPTTQYKLRKGKCVMTVTVPWKYAPGTWPVLKLLKGDKIRFWWSDMAPHNVVQTPRGDACNISARKAVKLYPTSGTSVKAKKGKPAPRFTTAALPVGKHAFVCGVPTHCSKGMMKLRVNVE